MWGRTGSLAATICELGNKFLLDLQKTSQLILETSDPSFLNEPLEEIVALAISLAAPL
jgi:hypothetical protein